MSREKPSREKSNPQKSGKSTEADKAERAKAGQVRGVIAVAPPHFRRERALLIAKRDRHERMFHRVVNDGAASGAFGTPYPSEAVRGILTMATGVSVWFREDGPLTAAEIADRFTHLALALVQADPAVTFPLPRRS